MSVSPFDQYLREYNILVEYKLVVDEQHQFTGVYVAPSFDSLHVWNGVVFVRSRAYATGRFKFRIDIPAEFPTCKTPPQVHFLTPLIHPLVNPATGELNVKHAFPEWSSSQSALWHVALYIKKLFYDSFDAIGDEAVFNAEAHRLATTDKEQYKAMVAQCVAASKEDALLAAAQLPTVRETVDDVPQDAPTSSVAFHPWCDTYEEAYKRILEQGPCDATDSVLNLPVDPPSQLMGLSWVAKGSEKPFSVWRSAKR